MTGDDVRHVADLARLALDDDDVRSLTEDLSAILGYIDRIADADVRAELPEVSAAPLRADAVVVASPEPLLAAAPALHEGEFSLPVVLP